jgi:hypothetical protein
MPNAKQIADLVLEEGPFKKDWVERWPASLQRDYINLLAIDLSHLGLDEFRRQSRALGETFLLSMNRPVENCPFLLESWYRLTGCQPLYKRPNKSLM